MPPTDDAQTTRAASLEELQRLRLAHVVLEVVSGPDAGAALDVGATGVTVGTSVESDLRLSDPMVSRRHLELRPEPDGVRAVDVGSRNGTFVFGARLRDVVLSSDAVLTLGATGLAVRLQAAPLEVPLSQRARFGDAIGTSTSMRHVFALLEQAAKSDVTVLLEGDSGTGKDVLASSLHQESRRKDGPFVVIDCGSIPEHLIESELFGHDKGAFTGAVAARAGAFEQASGGTVFLDEIGELPLEMQPKLLRVLESQSFRRVGGATPIKTDARIVAATNRRLREAVRKGEFREDLFYRLAVVHVQVASLADRSEDIPALAELFLRRASRDGAATLPPELLRLLLAYRWPGNARELRNVIDRFATFGRTDPRLLFGEPVVPGAPGPAIMDVDRMARLPYHESKRQLMDAFHAAVLPAAVTVAGGSVADAAEKLGIPRQSLYRMLKNLRAPERDGEEEP